MIKKNLLKTATLLAVLLCVSSSTMAATAVSTINVTVARYLSITNTSSMEFGSVMASTTAGTVVLETNGMRSVTGGVDINPADSYTPAKFIIEGKPNASFTLKLPDNIELRDSNGNRIEINNFKSSHKDGLLDANGALEITVGGQINLDPNQTSGDYSGTIVVELIYG